MKVDLYTWIEPGKLLAGRAPVDDADFAQWREAGVGLVINLNTKADSPQSLSDHCMTELHLPVRDFSAPSPALLDAAVASINEAISREVVVAVHCHAGLGRTGTVVACWLVDQGSTPEEAISQIRALRKGSIETVEQELAVRAYAERRRPESR